MSFYNEITVTGWTGSLTQVRSIQQFARDYPWECAIEDPEHAAAEVLGSLREGVCNDNDIHPEAERRLRCALEESAEEWTTRGCRGQT